jgi:hypothetical protein
MLTSVVGAPPAVAETVLRIANMAEPDRSIRTKQRCKHKST